MVCGCCFAEVSAPELEKGHQVIVRYARVYRNRRGRYARDALFGRLAIRAAAVDGVGCRASKSRQTFNRYAAMSGNAIGRG